MRVTAACTPARQSSHQNAVCLLWLASRPLALLCQPCALAARENCVMRECRRNANYGFCFMCGAAAWTFLRCVATTPRRMRVSRRASGCTCPQPMLPSRCGVALVAPAAQQNPHQAAPRASGAVLAVHGLRNAANPTSCLSTAALCSGRATVPEVAATQLKPLRCCAEAGNRP